MRPLKTTTATTTALTAAYASVVTYRVARFVWRQYLRPSTNLAQRYGSTGGGAWAVVTGATSGIGRGCARVWAQQGFHIVLIARTIIDLEAVADELQTTYGVQTMVVSMDAALCSERHVKELVQELNAKSMSVAILVNSVGIQNVRPVLLEEMEWSLAQRIIQVNCSFTVLLTSKMIPLLKQHASHHHCRSAILTVGSLTSTVPFAMQSTYAATKAFEAHWSRCLAAELRSDPMDVLCVRPGLTASRMNDLPVGGMVADADDMARRALGMLGLSVKSILPFPPHAFLDWLGSVVPERLQDQATRSMNLAKQHDLAHANKEAKNQPP